MTSETTHVASAADSGHGGGGGPSNGENVVADEPWGRFPNPVTVRALLVRLVTDAGEPGMTDIQASSAVAEALPTLEDPLDADIDSLVMLGVLKRRDEHTLVSTPLATEYLVGVAVSV